VIIEEKRNRIGELNDLKYKMQDTHQKRNDIVAMREVDYGEGFGESKEIKEIVFNIDKCINFIDSCMNLLYSFENQ
jgi:hypothetical protein